MSVTMRNSIVDQINSDIDNPLNKDSEFKVCYHIDTNDIMAFAKAVAEKLNGREINLNNNFILLNKKDMYIKLDWKRFSNKYAFYVSICGYLDSIMDPYY